MGPNLALATCAQYPGLPPDDQPLLVALERRGCRARPARWDDPAVPWGSFDAVVPRATWDYHERPDAFARWLDALERSGAAVFNPVPLLRWNMRKTYLRELEAAGVAVTPTLWVPRGSRATLPEMLDAVEAEAIVVKPAVSASAWQTWRVVRPGAADDAARFTRLVSERDVMVQPFLSAIETDGELSFVFLEGAYSHAVRKRAKPGDFRVQEEHGGTAEREEPGPDLVAQAARALAATPGPALYARVDGAVIEGALVVTELELVEPMLYFGWDATAAERMAGALEARLAAR